MPFRFQPQRDFEPSMDKQQVLEASLALQVAGHSRQGLTPVGAGAKRVGHAEEGHGRSRVLLRGQPESPERLRLVEVPGLQQALQQAGTAQAPLSPVRVGIRKQLDCQPVQQSFSMGVLQIGLQIGTHNKGAPGVAHQVKKALCCGRGCLDGVRET